MEKNMCYLIEWLVSKIPGVSIEYIEVSGSSLLLGGRDGRRRLAPKNLDSVA